MANFQYLATQDEYLFEGLDVSESEDTINTDNAVTQDAFLFQGLDIEEPENDDDNLKPTIPLHLDSNNFKQGVQIPPVETEVEEINDEPFVFFRNIKRDSAEVDKAYFNSFSPLIENNEQLAELFEKIHPDGTEDDKVSFVKYVFDELHDFEKQKFQDNTNDQKGRIPFSEVKTVEQAFKNASIITNAANNYATFGYWSNLVYDTSRLISEDLPEAYARYGGGFRDILEIVGYGMQLSLDTLQRPFIPVGYPTRSNVIDDSVFDVNPQKLADDTIDFWESRLKLQ